MQGITKLRLDLRRYSLGVDGAFFARLEKSRKKLLTVKELLCAVLFYYYRLDGLNHLEGGKSLLARHTLAAAADIVCIYVLTGIDNSAFKTAAIWTFHALLSFFWYFMLQSYHTFFIL
jgi:hypothetical protein